MKRKDHGTTSLESQPQGRSSVRASPQRALHPPQQTAGRHKLENIFRSRALRDSGYFIFQLSLVELFLLTSTSTGTLELRILTYRFLFRISHIPWCQYSYRTSTRTVPVLYCSSTAQKSSPKPPAPMASFSEGKNEHLALGVSKQFHIPPIYFSRMQCCICR